MGEKKSEKKEVKCDYCKKKVDLSNDKYTLLGDYSGEKTINEAYFHFECFKKWYNEKVTEKAKSNVKKMQDKAKGLFSGLKDLGIGNIGGLRNIQSMLNTDLDNSKNQVPDLSEIFGKIGKQEILKKKTKKTTKKKTNNKKNHLTKEKGGIS